MPLEGGEHKSPLFETSLRPLSSSAGEWEGDQKVGGRETQNGWEGDLRVGGKETQIQ